MRRIKAVDRVLEAADLLFKFCKSRLRLGIVISRAHGLRVLAHRGAEVAAALLFIQQGGIFVIQLFQQLIGLGRSIFHFVHPFLAPYYGTIRMLSVLLIE